MRSLIHGEKNAMVEDLEDDGRCFGYENKELLGIKTRALLGYMAIDIYRPPAGAFWGAFNERVVVERSVDGLVSKFKSGQLESCIDETAIELAVKPEWIANLDDKVEHVSGMDIEGVPEIKFTEDGSKEILHPPSWKLLPPGAGNLWFLGGNHRREALTRFLDSVDARRQVLKVKVEKITKAMEEKSEGGSNEEEELEQAKAELKEKTETLRHGGKWAVRLYDRGTERRHRRERKLIERAQSSLKKNQKETRSRRCSSSFRGTNVWGTRWRRKRSTFKRSRTN
jgi:hypothetical protein